MPVYQLVHSGIALSLEQRDRIAQGVLEIHHSETEAPELFVRLMIEPLPLGLIYTAGKIDPSLILHCNIRAGRSQATRQRIIRRCYDLLAEVTQVPPDQIVVALAEVESSWVMEAGFFLPEANHDAEAAWLTQLQKTYPGQYDEWGPNGERPAVAGTTDGEAGVAERAADLRRLAKEMLAQAERHGTDALTLLEPLNELIAEHQKAASNQA